MGAANLIGVITLSPAVDITYGLETVRLGQVNRVQQVTRSPGGKGLNVARVLKKLGADAVLHAPLGGASGAWIRERLEELQVNLVETEIQAETRSAVAVVGKEVSVFNEPATPISESELERLEGTLDTVSIAVVTGSVPASVTVDRFSKFLGKIKQKSEILVVDTTGEYLIAASKHADYLKPNLEELLAATALTEGPAIAMLRQQGSRVILSLGEQGVVLHSQQRVGFRAPKQQGNPTGAGDALTAGFVSTLARLGPASESESLRFACALSAASILSPVAGDFSPELVTKLLAEVEEA
ncbi:MAG: PfkB family carbohydrate kinase [Aquiluna sp.]|nr:PfkB family carbohydrate kinase [Aquiluna sp.]